MTYEEFQLILAFLDWAEANEYIAHMSAHPNFEAMVNEYDAVLDTAGATSVYEG